VDAVVVAGDDLFDLVPGLHRAPDNAAPAMG
jgi:hypothetical protein